MAWFTRSACTGWPPASKANSITSLTVSDVPRGGVADTKANRCARSRGRMDAMEALSKVTVPDRGGSIPAKVLSNVDLPDPFLPITTMVLPGGRKKDNVPTPSEG